MDKLDLRKNKHGKAIFPEKISMTSLVFPKNRHNLPYNALKTSQKCVFSYQIQLFIMFCISFGLKT